MKKLFYWLFKKSGYLRRIAIEVDQEVYNIESEEYWNSYYCGEPTVGYDCSNND